MKTEIPAKAVGRLSLYRRLLMHDLSMSRTHIHSHEIASMAQVSAAQVRRDLMLTHYEGSAIKGYEVAELVRAIGALLDPGLGANLAVVGAGNLGRAITTYFAGRRPNLRLVAAFDADPAVIGRTFNGVPCYPVADLGSVVRRDRIVAAILTVPAGAAQHTADLLVAAGIKGILNFAPAPLRVPPHVFVEELDMTMSLEKVAYFACGSERAQEGST